MKTLVTYNKTVFKTTKEQTIYIHEWFNGVKRYKVKCRTMILVPVGKYKKVKFVPSWRDISPVENEELYNINPEMFSGYVTSVLRQGMINNNQTWEEREALV